jgi:site-specific DNA-cytosine methylase
MVLKVIDLFSGSKSVQKAVDAKLSRVFEVTSLDVACADINTDILDCDYKNEFEPGHFDVIWCSPPCTTFSPLRRCNIGRFNITAESIEEGIQNLGVPLLRKSEEIIEYFQPKFYFVENGQMCRLKKLHRAKPRPFFLQSTVVCFRSIIEKEPTSGQTCLAGTLSLSCVTRNVATII